jgi:xylan 1,4-beta-xylosidase
MDPARGLLDISFISDDHAGLLRFTGALAGFAAKDLTERRRSADFESVTFTS